MNFLNDLIFKIKKPKVILVAGENRKHSSKTISGVLSSHFKIGENIFVAENDLSDKKKNDFLIKNSSLFILVATNVGKIPEDKEPFAGEEIKTIKIREAAASLPKKDYLIVNFDDETVRMTRNESEANIMTFGLQEGADLRASDFTGDGEVNFKINYRGSSVPFWFAQELNKETVYSVLAAVACGLVLGFNLVEMSQTLRKLQFFGRTIY
jgi:UDP-N-acetylmuramate-alanine ligase